MQTPEEMLRIVNENPHVAEAATLYDSVLIGDIGSAFSSDASVQGWFTSLNAFGAKAEHSFFKTRTKDQAGLAYCNAQSSESLVQPYILYSVGVAFWSPSSWRINETATESCGEETDPIVLDEHEAAVASWFRADLPNHCSLTVKTNQDVRLECAAIATPPGYGPQSSGVAFEMTQGGTTMPGSEAPFIPTGNWAVTQGVPNLRNRFVFPEPLVMPKNSSLECIIKLEDVARNYLQAVGASIPENYVWAPLDGSVDNSIEFEQRWGVTVSFMGVRLTQKRGEYRA